MSPTVHPLQPRTLTRWRLQNCLSYAYVTCNFILKTTIIVSFLHHHLKLLSSWVKLLYMDARFYLGGMSCSTWRTINWPKLEAGYWKEWTTAVRFFQLLYLIWPSHMFTDSLAILNSAKRNSSLLNWGNSPYPYAKHMEGSDLGTLYPWFPQKENMDLWTWQITDRSHYLDNQRIFLNPFITTNYQIWCQEEISLKKCVQSKT